MSDLSWPRLMYHKDQAPGGWRIDSEKDRSMLGPGWMDEPPQKPQAPKALEVAPPAPPAPPAPVTQVSWEALPVEELRVLAKSRGLSVHHRAGKEKIIQALKDATALVTPAGDAREPSQPEATA